MRALKGNLTRSLQGMLEAEELFLTRQINMDQTNLGKVECPYFLYRLGSFLASVPCIAAVQFDR